MGSAETFAQQPGRDGVRALILKAARDSFRRVGLKATTMEDVAKAAGTSRQTVYTCFANRRDLVGAAIADRISEIADDILARHWDEELLINAFVDRTAAIVDNIRTDAELALLLGAGSPLTLHQALWQPAVRQRGFRDWQPWLRQARRTGLIRGDVTDDDVYEWIQTVLPSMVLRPDPDTAHERALIRTFLVQSIRPGRQDDGSG